MAKDFREYTFAVADEDDFATEVKDLGLSESGEEVNAAILDEGGRRFAMEPDDFDADALRAFVSAFKKGEPPSHPPTILHLRGPTGWLSGAWPRLPPDPRDGKMGMENPCSFAFSLFFFFVIE